MKNTNKKLPISEMIQADGLREGNPTHQKVSARVKSMAERKFTNVPPTTTIQIEVHPQKKGILEDAGRKMSTSAQIEVHPGGWTFIQSTGWTGLRTTRQEYTNQKNTQNNTNTHTHF